MVPTQSILVPLVGQENMETIGDADEARERLREQARLLDLLESHVRSALSVRAGETVRLPRPRQALEWLTGSSRARGLTFEEVCAALGLDPVSVRSRVLRACGVRDVRRAA